MSAKKIRGLIRLGASITVCVILLPFVIRLYLAVSPDTTAHEVWMAFVQAAPFGESIAGVVLSLWEEAQSGADALVEWLAGQKLSFAQHFSLEMAEMIFTSVVLLMISNVMGKKLFKDTSGGLFNHMANAVFQVFLTFCASLVVAWVFDLFSTGLERASGIAHDVTVYAYSGSLGIASLVMLMVSGLLLWDALILIGIGCLKITVSYGAFLWLLLSQMQGGSVWLLALGVVLWLGLLWLLQVSEDLLIKKK